MGPQKLGSQSLQGSWSGRAGRTYSRAGCQTCKIRRVKCDEERPSCRRCSSTGRQCDYATVARQVTPWGVTNLQSSPFVAAMGQGERRSFEYYFYCAGPSIAGVLDLGFWKGAVLQICRSEPAVWDALVATSLYYQEPPSQEVLGYGPFWRRSSGNAQDRGLGQTQQQAATCYLRSLAAVQTQIQQGTIDINVALVSCILFLCIEALQGHNTEAMKLYQQGTQMIDNLVANTRSDSQPIAALLEQIIAIYTRLGAVAYITAGVVFELPILPCSTSQPYHALSTARNSLIRIIGKILSYEGEVATHEKHFGRAQFQQLFSSKKQDLELKLSQWHQDFKKIPQSNKQQDAKIELASRSTLEMMYHGIYIIVAASLRLHETLFDELTDSFEAIVYHAEIVIRTTTEISGGQPHFTFEIGVGMPLLLTAGKCRHSNIRHRALSLLRQSPQTQGFYLVGHGSAVIAKGIDIEESLGCDPTNPDRVEEETRRLQYVAVCNEDQSAFSLRIARKHFAGQSRDMDSLVLIEERVPL